jgi:hypothetical protein
VCLCSDEELSEDDGIVFSAMLDWHTRWRPSRRFTALATRCSLHSLTDNAKLLRASAIQTQDIAVTCCLGQGINDRPGGRFCLPGATLRTARS